MKIVIAAVISANGKLTHENDPDIYKWTSREDQEFFFNFIKRSNLIVMGSGTYESIRKRFKTEKGKLRIVLTQNPEKYKSEQILGQLEFSSETPRDLVRRLNGKYTQMLLAGGSKIYSLFLKDGLIDEIYLTIEPVLFGWGKNLFADEEFESRLHLVSLTKLNKKGTILLKYRVNNGKA